MALSVVNITSIFSQRAGFCILLGKTVETDVIPGMEIYPLRASFLEVISEPLLAGVLGGVCFLFAAIILSLVTACYMSQRRRRRCRETRKGEDYLNYTL